MKLDPGVKLKGGCAYQTEGRRNFAGPSFITGSMAALVMFLVLPAMVLADGSRKATAAEASDSEMGDKPGPIASGLQSKIESSTVTGSCTACHQIESAFSHPVNMRPEMEIPSAFPLTAGRMTCTTCHIAEGAETHGNQGSASESLLRGDKVGVGFCRQCHSATSPGTSDQHATLLSRAHTRWPDDRQSEGPARPGASSILATASQQCLTCHDGMIAADIDHRPGTTIARMPSLGNEMSHPVGVAYAATGTATGSNLIPRSQLDRRIRLTEGRVECTSCHSLYSSRPHDLVISNDGSALCLSCHDF